MTARSIALELMDIRHLSSLYHRAVEEMRAKAVKTTVDTLYNRYRARVNSHEERRSFVDWLVAMEHLERTFAHRTTGTSLPTRRRWAFGYFNFMNRKELTLADDPDNLWIIDAMNERINTKHHDPKWLIDVEVAVRKAMPNHNLKEGRSFVFARVERPSDELTQPE